ncbi:MAG: hypothetical protein M1814_002173 [Vezdaea aestivalis]|nr:MAG: hypothetical protein M1814_002173 [Vezdaea aestivalis]
MAEARAQAGAPARRKRSRLSLDELGGSQHNDAGLLFNDGKNANKRRRRTMDVDPLHGGADDARTGNLALEPRIRRISKHVVDARWAPLLEAAQKQVKDLFASVERPVVMRIPEGKRRQEAQTALGSVLKRLNARVPRMPFPPTTKDTHFDFEKLLDLNLTPTIHSTSLLINEIEKEEQMLASDNARLKGLEQELSSLEAQRSRQLQSAHPVLSEREKSIPERNDRLSLIESVDMRQPEPIANEASLAEVLEQVKPHLATLQSNAFQVRGVSEEITRARAAVDGVLYLELELEEYERLVHGGN